MKNIKFYLTFVLLNIASIISSFSMEKDDAMDIDPSQSSQQTPELLVGQKRKLDEQEQGGDLNESATKRLRLGDDTSSLASMQQTLEELTNERILIDRAYKGLVNVKTIDISQIHDLPEKALRDHKYAWFVLMKISDKYLDKADFIDLFKDIKEKAIKGTADYQNLFGIMYLNVIGVNKDLNKAVYWYTKAAEQGCAFAQSNLGIRYEAGHGVDKDLNKAVYWYGRAVDQNLAVAQFYLGICYENGTGVEKDLNAAIYWYLKAAEQGFASAQLKLGYLYEYGTGVDKDYTQAFKWYEKAAEQGFAIAQLNLGNMYINMYQDSRVLQNLNECAKWFQKAAEQEYVEAQFYVGRCYEKGIGVAQDYAQAVRWYLRTMMNGEMNGDPQFQEYASSALASLLKCDFTIQMPITIFYISHIHTLKTYFKKLEYSCELYQSFSNVDISMLDTVPNSKHLHSLFSDLFKCVSDGKDIIDSLDNLDNLPSGLLVNCFKPTDDFIKESLLQNSIKDLLAFEQAIKDRLEQARKDGDDSGYALQINGPLIYKKTIKDLLAFEYQCNLSTKDQNPLYLSLGEDAIHQSHKIMSMLQGNKSIDNILKSLIDLIQLKDNQLSINDFINHVNNRYADNALPKMKNAEAISDILIVFKKLLEDFVIDHAYQRNEKFLNKYPQLRKLL